MIRKINEVVNKNKPEPGQPTRQWCSKCLGLHQIRFQPFVSSMDQTKDRQRAEHLCIGQGRKTTTLDRQGHSQAEKGQPVDKINKQ